jgi:hypothetical protein
VGGVGLDGVGEGEEEGERARKAVRSMKKRGLKIVGRPLVFEEDNSRQK